MNSPPSRSDAATSGGRAKRGTQRFKVGRREVRPDPQFEIDLASDLRGHLSSAQLLETLARYIDGVGYVDVLMRRVCLRALVKEMGAGVIIQRNVSIAHPETLKIGTGVFIGEQTIIEGRLNGQCTIGDGAWIGPHSFLDGRDLVIEAYVGWGPGAKVLSSERTGMPTAVPIIQTELCIGPVRIGAGADIGANAIISPGITVGRGALVGAGAILTEDVPEFAKVAGAPAKLIGWRRKGRARVVPTVVGAPAIVSAAPSKKKRRDPEEADF